MSKRPFVLLLGVSVLMIACVLAKAQSGSPINIPLQNPSFDQLTEPLSYSDPCGLEERSVAKIPGWTFTTIPGSGGAGGLLQPNGEQPVGQPNGCNVPFPPNGHIVAFVQNTTISQTVKVPQLPSGFYTLRFYTAAYFYWYPGKYTASLSLSSFYESPACDVSGHQLGDFGPVTLVCYVRDKPASTLTISLSGTGWDSLFAGPVSLTFTPQ